MAVEITTKAGSFERVGQGTLTTYSRVYNVTGASNSNQVHAEFRNQIGALIPETITDEFTEAEAEINHSTTLIRELGYIDSSNKHSLWELTVNWQVFTNQFSFGSRKTTPYNFQASPSTIHVEKGVSHIATYGSDGAVILNKNAYDGRVNIDNEGVSQGLDILIPESQITAVAELRNFSIVDLCFISGLIGTTNNNEQLGFTEQELLLVGVSSPAFNFGDDVQLTYTFKISKTVLNLKVGEVSIDGDPNFGDDIVIGEKKGWHYLHTVTTTTESNTDKFLQTDNYLVEQIYKTADWTELKL